MDLTVTREQTDGFGYNEFVRPLIAQHRAKPLDGQGKDLVVEQATTGPLVVQVVPDGQWGEIVAPVPFDHPDQLG